MIYIFGMVAHTVDCFRDTYHSNGLPRVMLMVRPLPVMECKRCGFHPWVGKVPEAEMKPAPVLALGNP